MKNKFVTFILAAVLVLQFVTVGSMAVYYGTVSKKTLENGKEYKFRVDVSYVEGDRVYFSIDEMTDNYYFYGKQKLYGIISEDEEDEGFYYLTVSEAKDKDRDNINMSRLGNAASINYKLKDPTVVREDFYITNRDDRYYESLSSDNTYITMRVNGSECVITQLYVDNIPVEEWLKQVNS